MNVHFKGVYFLTQKLLPLIKDGGPIVNISSGLERFALPSSSAYGATKGAVEVLTRYLAKELGYVIEAVQKGFPDCEAKRRIAPERWQRAHIEFEFESKNLRQHGHPVMGCDVIVCWRHNWEECPKHIEVVELSNVIKSLEISED